MLILISGASLHFVASSYSKRPGRMISPPYPVLPRSLVTLRSAMSQLVSPARSLEGVPFPFSSRAHSNRWVRPWSLLSWRISSSFSPGLPQFRPFKSTPTTLLQWLPVFSFHSSQRDFLKCKSDHVPVLLRIFQWLPTNPGRKSNTSSTRPPCLFFSLLSFHALMPLCSPCSG